VPQKNPDDTGAGTGDGALGSLLDPHIDTSKPPKKTAAKKRTASTSTRASRSGTRTGGWTASRFARELLGRLGAPVTNGNVRALVSWMAAEGGHWANTARFNPLNTTQAMPGDAGSMNSVGVRVFTSWQQGLAATVKTLENGNYGHILSALKQGSNPGAVLNAVVASPWSTYGNGITLVGSARAYGTGAGHAAGPSYSGGATSGGGGGGKAGTPEPLSKKEYLDNPDIAANYGYLTAYLHNKEIGPILAEAAKKGWGANQLLGALQGTDWWKKMSSTARQWQAQKRLDPATARQRLGSMTRQIQTLAKSTLGYRLDDQRALHLANTAIASDWSAQDLQHAVGAEFKFQGRNEAYKGAAGRTLDSLQQLSSAYLVPLSRHTLNHWTRQVLEGVMQPQDFENYVKTQAESLYPTLKGALRQGQTVADYLNPYAELAAQTLEIAPGQINWFHPKWAKALNTTTPDGQRAPMSLSDWGSYLRSLPEYKHTQQADQQGASFALNIAQTFGKVAL
jgi:hypothetical protein